MRDPPLPQDGRRGEAKLGAFFAIVRLLYKHCTIFLRDCGADFGRRSCRTYAGSGAAWSEAHRIGAARPGKTSKHTQAAPFPISNGHHAKSGFLHAKTGTEMCSAHLKKTAQEYATACEPKMSRDFCIFDDFLTFLRSVRLRLGTVSPNTGEFFFFMEATVRSVWCVCCAVSGVHETPCFKYTPRPPEHLNPVYRRAKRTANERACGHR